jgi:glycosyltransferase involved in cell wall biosynthesis
MNSETGIIRVLHLATRLVICGVSSNLGLLTARLDPNRYETFLAHGRPEDGEREDLELIGRLHLRPIVLDSLRRAPGPWDVSSLHHVNRLIEKNRPHILHTHMPKAGAVGRIPAVMRRIAGAHSPRMVHTYHGIRYGYLPPGGAFVHIVLDRWLARYTDVLIAICEQDRVALTQQYRIAPPEKVRIIPLGFEFEWLERIERQRGWLRADLGVGDSTVLVGLVGRLSREKNHALGLRSFARMLRENHDLDARLVIVGDGTLRSDLERFAVELGIRDQTVFCGWETDRARIFSDLNINLLCSISEGTPVAIIEGLAASVPAVATRVGGVPDVVGSAEGALVESGDEAGLAAALAKFARNPVRLDACYAETIRRRFSAARLVSDIETLYEELLTAPPKYVETS